MSGNKILIVDDDQDFLQLLEFDLKKHGFQVVTAGDGEEGLVKAKGEKPDSEHVVCWVSTYGKGTVFATTLGHDLKTVKLAEYHQLLANGILWACGKLDAKGAIMPGYGPKK